ncbi:ABC transporter permease [Lactobacillus sp. YT155]|uniref:ABC transporter permease n=1 Tax=Lactobacillus sp. YT155 TaxID=3060955 RepID=UPI00265F3C71|nr:ABC transporter permease [Lactobacillus sp. YT155]MDO1605939.1 ABC transporter permease [Lactobacillus sp. YT155]
MTALIMRNIKLYFDSKSKVFFSLLGALISFILYIIFLSKNMQDSWSNISEVVELLDNWIVGGTLAITAITTTFHAASMIARDRESDSMKDFVLTDLSFIKIQLSYLISSAVIGFIMQVFMYVIMYLYFKFQDSVVIRFTPELILIAFISAFTWAVIAQFIVSWIPSTEAQSKINGIIGAAAGFFAGVYLPIGFLPSFAQTIMKYTPASYGAALYRQLLTKDSLNQAFEKLPAHAMETFKENMGISIKLNQLTTVKQEYLILILFVLLFVVLYSLCVRKFKKILIG